MNTRKTIKAAAAIVAVSGALLAPTSQALAADAVTGQGSSFVSNFFEKCKADSAAKGISVNYQPTGSGAGRRGFIDGTVDFAASDVPFSTDEAANAKNYVYVPVVSGGVAVAYNLPGVSNLKLDGATIAGIFAGKIQIWNDKAIAKLNPGAKLPKQVIRVVVRSDSSGTSNVFSTYLNAVAPAAFEKGGLSQFPTPKGNGIAQKGSDGVATYVAGPQGKGAITYVEVSFANERKLPVALIGGTKPTADAVTKMLAAAKPAADGVVTVDFKTTPSGAYPIVALSYAIAPQSGPKAAGVKAFLAEAVGSCQTKAESLGYAPLPAPIVAAATANLAKIG